MALQSELRAWTVRDSAELYNVEGWGRGFFSINDAGNVEVTPAGPGSARIDLKHLVDDLRSRGLRLPMLIRFSDILKTRVEQLAGAFRDAINDNDYKGRYLGVFPIKVNQARHVVEELIEYGRRTDLGLEAGSKPELLVALALQDNPDALVLCNGYKDRAYIETALLAQKLGRKVIIVIDQMAEVDTIMQAARDLDIRPIIGIRARLSTKGAGKWVESTGDRSKFGLNAAEMVTAVEKLREAGFLDCLQLLHFHIGSRSPPFAPSRTRSGRRVASSSSCTRWAPTCTTSTAAAGSASTTTARRRTSTPRSTTRCRSMRPTS
jgi:arginine decarboxylase